jgi:hypothetical protein
MTPTPPRQRVCDYCELPLPDGWWGNSRARAAEHETCYCCLGCRIAAAIIDEKGEDGLSRTMLNRLGISVFFTMNVIAFTMALWTTDVYGASEPAENLALVLDGLFRSLTLIFSVPVLLLLGLPLFEHAWIGLRRGILSTDWLLASGVAAAFAISFLSVFRGRGSAGIERAVSEAGGPGLTPICSGRLGDCNISIRVSLGVWLPGTRALDGPGGHADRLSVRLGARRSTGRVERTGQRSGRAGVVPQRRGPRAAGRGHRDSLRQDRNPDDRRSTRLLREQGLRVGPVLLSAVADAESQGLAVSLVGWNGMARGLFVFDERGNPRPEK